MSIFSIIQLVVQFAPAVKAIIDAATTNASIIDRIKELSQPLASLMESIGAELFPKAAPTLHILGGVIASFDPNVTKWIQGSLNTELAPNPPLVVDGIYGPHTRDVVSALQTKLGLTVDGIAGQITQAALQALLSKNPKL